jgi:ParB family chromosome partitioning protein
MSTVTDALETVLVPLHKLSAWDGNVRRTRPDARIPELAVSIRAVGLLENLVIRKASKTKYHVVAGKRRLQALLQLLKEGVIERDFPVPCRVLPKDSDLIEVSLAENVQHEALHPADEFEAFYKLIESGHSAAEEDRPIRIRRWEECLSQAVDIAGNSESQQLSRPAAS